MIKQASVFWHLEVKIFCLIIIFLTACGSPPLAQPSEVVSTKAVTKTSTNETVSVPSPIATVVDESPKMNLTPLTTGTIAGKATATETRSKVPTSTPMAIPTSTSFRNTPITTTGENVVIAVTSSPTAIVAPILPQNTIVENYTFSPPYLILETDRTIHLGQWLPNSNEQLLVRSHTTDKFTVEVFDISTGKTTRLAEMFLSNENSTTF